MVLRHNVVAAQLQIQEELLTTAGVVVFLEIGAWFQIEFGHYYKVEYFEIGHFITQKKIHAVLGNSLEFNEGKNCVELFTSSASSTKRTYQCDQDITWIAKYMKLRC